MIESDAPARERLSLWLAAVRGEITTAELYAGLKALRKHYGDAVYFRPSRQ